MRNKLLEALKEQKTIKEKEWKTAALEMVRIKKENAKISESLRETYRQSCEHIKCFAKAILHEQRTNELPKGFDEKLLIDDARLKEWLFDYAKGIDEKHRKECGVL